MSKNYNVSDFKELFKDLREDVRKDELYWVRNDAKLRAVNTVKSYEEFKNIVDAAHMAPLTKADKEKRVEAKWNKAVQ